MPKRSRANSDRIARSAEGLRRLGIGGTAVGSGLNAHPEYHKRMIKKLSELTGLKLYESDNLFEVDAIALRTRRISLHRFVRWH